MSKIFIVDDDSKILKSLDDILSKNGYIVKSAKSPDEFLHKIKDSPPAVAIIDIFYGYQQMDGEELIKILSNQFPSIQCIVMSGESDIQKTLSCLKNGALDFLEKPVSLPRLYVSHNARNASSFIPRCSAALFSSQSCRSKAESSKRF